MRTACSVGSEFFRRLASFCCETVMRLKNTFEAGAFDMTSKFLTHGLPVILGIAAIGGLQYSTLINIANETSDISAQKHYSYAEQKAKKNIQENIEQKTEQLKVMTKMPSLGFRNLYANYAFVQFLQYFGDEESRKVTDYSLSPDYLSVSLKFDPYYRYFYLFLSQSTTFYAGMPDKTVALMGKGLSAFGEKKPADSYYIWRYKGTDELLFLNNGKLAQKSFEMAAKWAAQSDTIEGQLMSQQSKQTAQFLADNPDSKLAQINAWGSILTTALDNETRKRAIARIQELGGDVVLGSDGQLQIKYAQAEEAAGEQKPDS